MVGRARQWPALRSDKETAPLASSGATGRNGRVLIRGDAFQEVCRDSCTGARSAACGGADRNAAPPVLRLGAGTVAAAAAAPALVDPPPPAPLVGHANAWP